ncbi:MAG: DUF4432 family protein [Planctomycetota bacterium]|nr:MAG: DUF4432 family protein [Planctomycetota bacterium]
MARKRAKSALADVPVINPSQLGGIETSVLDNGPGRGVRIAWINTGGGLRYKVVIDRGLDIADAELMGESLTWHSLTGITSPSLAYSRGIDWLRGFYGGLLVSCGPLHTGAPFEENGVEYGLHGTHSHTRAIVETIENPDPKAGKGEMRISGLVRTAMVFNPNVELRRTISSMLGENSICVHDKFTNRGNKPIEHAWLLHINFGYPLLEPGASTYCYKGKLTYRGDSVDWFGKRKDFRAAPKPLESHRGRGEVFTYIDPPTDSKGMVTCGLVNKKRGFAVRIEFTKKDYARLGNWQHWGPDGSYTGALEPMTGGVEGRPVDRERGWVKYLKPGQSVDHRCTITATNDKGDIDRLLRLNR